jgi:hypothetical protein
VGMEHGDDFPKGTTRAVHDGICKGRTDPVGG